MSRTRKPFYSLSLLLVMFACVLWSVPSLHAQGIVNLASIRGQVLDAKGQPLSGALVAVRPPQEPLLEQFVLTDRLGMFSVPGLSAGEYLVRVTKAAFLPAVVSGIEVFPGMQEVVSINLQTAIDFVSQGIRRGSVEDMKWALRSAQVTRPILRHNSSVRVDDASGGAGGDEPSGYVQVYSTSIAAAGGSADAVGSQFAVTVPVTGQSRVRVEGQYTESENQPRGVGATYEFSSGGRKQSALGINIRQGAHFSGSVPGANEREVAVEYVEQVQWSDNLVLQYGTTIGRTEGSSESRYLRPELSAAWVVRPRTTVKAAFSRRDPTASQDPIRGDEYFDRAVYIPPELEHFSHVELGLSQLLSNGVQVSAGAFRDELGTQAFLIDAEDGRRAFLVVDGTAMPTNGFRFVVDKDFDGFEASLGYTYASAFGFDEDVDSPEDLRSAATRRGFHVVTARINGTIELTQTEVTAVYRWAPGYSVTPVDPYQLFAEYNDPTLSLTIAQDLPSAGFFPAKLQAVVDARNLFEPSFGSRRTIHAGYPRILRGGIHFKF